MSLRDTRAANEMPSGEAIAGFAAGRAILQTKRENGGHMRFPDHTSYIRYQAARAQAQLRQQFRAAQAAAGPTITTPTAPTNLCIFPGDSQVSLSFTAPSSNGGAEITDYQYSLNGGTSWSSTGSASSPVTVSGLSSDGTVYSIQLRAVNSAGGGSASSAVSAAALSNFTPSDVAGLNLWLDSHDTGKVTATSGAVTAWTSRDPSANIFAKARTGTITYDLPSRINNRPAINFQTPSVQLEKTLNLGPSNQITVFAIVKQTNASIPNSEIFSTTPFQHFDLFIQGGDNHLEVDVTNFQHASTNVILNESSLVSVTVSNTGGSNSAGQINMFVNGDQNIINSDRPNNLTWTLNKLLPWKVSGQGFIGDIGEVITYPSVLSATDRQRVEGYLAWKWGLEESLPSGHPYKSAPVSITVPDAPTGISAVAGNTQATVSFTPPSNNGGSPITSYTVTSSPDGITATGSSSPIIVTDLSNGTPYTFTVVATNSVGNSVPSAASTAVTPAAVTRQAFTTVGATTWTVPDGVTSIEYLVVGGGGGSGGGYDTGGGGGGGGGTVKEGTLSVVAGTSYTIVVGDGGIGAVIDRTIPSETNGVSGENSIFHTIIANGGGGGFSSRNKGDSAGGTGVIGETASTGGSGGGSSGDANGAGGGGGGASGDGTSGISNGGGIGGSGISSSLTGISVEYGNGGRGANGNANNNPVAGAVNTGNGARGGGAASGSQRQGAKGGSGIVVIKYSL